MAQLIPLAEWARGPNGFRYPPTAVTLGVYAKTGQIYPPPVKQGRRWVVDENARFIGLTARPEVSGNLSRHARVLLEKAVYGGPSKTT